MRKAILLLLTVSLVTMVGCSNSDLELLKGEARVKADYKQRLEDLQGKQQYKMRI